MMAAMSKSLGDGLSLEQVIERATVNPARAIRREDLGSLAEGGPADIAVLAMENGVPQVRCILTVRDGSIVWDSDGLAAADWIKMGPYSNFK